MQNIYAMSDIHGMLRSFRERLDQLNMANIRSGKAKLILLGDYIDRGLNSLGVLETIYELQYDLGDNLVVLMGNHDKWFLNFLRGDDNNWLGNYKSTTFVSQFMSDDGIGRINHLVARGKQYLASELVLNAFEAYNKDLLSWMKSLPLFHETEHQIYVHAGVDEEAEDLWVFGTSDEMFIEKYPPTTGYFYKDIIAGHVSTSTASGNRNNHDIYFDGKSHFFIDGIDSYPHTANESDCIIPLLQYTEENGIGCYFSIGPDNQKTLICKKEW